MDIIIQQQIALLQKQLSALLPLTPEQQHKLDDKLNLEFNYNSNHIEGNTLTYSETKQLLKSDLPPVGGNHTMREFEEMKASKKALQMIRSLAADKERHLTEMFIKNLNEILLVEPFWKNAELPNGETQSRKITIGEYKRHANSVRLQNGEMFDYASPAETPMLMGDMLEWYKIEQEKGEMHPIELAALLHYRFVRIHPFDGGNGRISRLLLN